MDASGLDFEVIVKADALLDLTFRPNAVGLWTFEGTASSSPFELTVSRTDVAATGRRSSVAAVQALYHSIGAILDKI